MLVADEDKNATYRNLLKDKSDHFNLRLKNNLEVFFFNIPQVGLVSPAIAGATKESGTFGCLHPTKTERLLASFKNTECFCKFYNFFETNAQINQLRPKIFANRS